MKKTDYLVILAPMVTELGLQGNALLVFAMIHGFTKDGSHKFVGSFGYISSWLNISERSVKEIISNLIHDGYITRTQELTDRNRPINVYTTNYDELLARVSAGEVLNPTSIKSRRASKKVNSAQCAPLITTIANGAQNAPLIVHNFPFNGAQCAPNNYKDNNNDTLSDACAQAPAQGKSEEREFYNIFFLRNAADPAAEVRRFLGFYQSRGWQAKDGTQYDTPAKREGLAYGWDFKSGDRLPRCQATDDFYKFLQDLYTSASEAGDIDPNLILDQRTKYETNLAGYFWHCRKEVQRWVNMHLDVAVPIKKKHFGDRTIKYISIN